jgi:hypothetical protein
MDKELKDESLKVFKTKRIEAVGQKVLLEKLLVDKQTEHLAEILSIRTNIVYLEDRIKYADKYLASLDKETPVN